jgi:hypothetical protein
MQTAECHVAIEQLTTYLEDPTQRQAEADAAMEHIRGCTYCQGKMGHLVRALSVDEEDRLTCQECEDLLPDYLQAEAAGRAGEPRWRSVALHLEVCPHCAESYAALAELAELAFAENEVEPPHFPTPDLSFLRPHPAPAPVAWHLDELGRLIIEASSGLLSAWQAARLEPATAAAELKSSKPARILGQISLKEAVEDLEVTITAKEMRDDPALSAVAVVVGVPSRGGWPNLVDIEVTVKGGGLEPKTQLTDAFGEAIFEGIATESLTHLVFEIDAHGIR